MTSHDARIALITGGNRGLGRSEALAFATDGTDVVITYRSHADEAKAVVAEIEALGRTAVALQLDTAVPETFDAFADTLRAALAQTWDRDGFDVLVNNAGFAAPTPLGGTDVATVRALLDTHVTGVVMLTQTLVPLVADGGRIVNTSSGLARFTGDFGLSVYASAKGAIEVWTRYLAQELGPRADHRQRHRARRHRDRLRRRLAARRRAGARPARRRDRDGPRRPPRGHRRRGRRDRVGPDGLGHRSAHRGLRRDATLVSRVVGSGPVSVDPGARWQGAGPSLIPGVFGRTGNAASGRLGRRDRWRTCDPGH